MKALQRSFSEILRYPSAVVGLLLILGMVALALYAVIGIPYPKAISLWRGEEADWYNSPRNARPVWMDWFTKEKLSRTISMNSAKDQAVKTVETNASGFPVTTLTYTFDYPYDTFPKELSLYFTSSYDAKKPFLTILWYTPDGREIRLGEFGVEKTYTYRISQDNTLLRRLDGMLPEKGLFADPNSDPENPVPLKGTYQLVVTARAFEKNTKVDAEFISYGEIQGWAGTDHRRRDIMIALIWGAPIALSFGLLAAIGTSFLTLIFAAIGVWFGGWVDGIIQRLTEVNLVLPFLSILIMIGTFYSKSLWVILGVTILLSIFGAAIKTYRAIFIQVREATYIEAARAYGASNMRVIFLYLIPRIIPTVIPALVLSVPTYVFLEATLAVLGLGDPVLPTWGKVINDATSESAVYNGYYYWMLEPAVLLMITGLSFAMVGFSLDRIFNPRLRTQD